MRPRLRQLTAVICMLAFAEFARAQEPSAHAEPDIARSAGRAFDLTPPEFLPPVTSPRASQAQRAGRVKQAAIEDESVRPVRIGGWTEVSYTASTDKVSQLPMGFNDRANQFLLQQNWLQLDRPAETEGEVSPTFGFRSDTILPGSDYQFTLPRGLFNRQLTAHHGQPNLYGIDPVQFYAETCLPNVAEGMTVKVGRFYAPWGIEAVNAPGNALLSHTYTFVYDPFTQTGVMSGVKINSDWSGQAGIVIGNDTFIAPGNEPKFSGNLMWSPPEGANSLRFSTIIGSGRYNRRQLLDNLNLFELIYTHHFGERLKYSLAGTFGYQDNVPAIGLANWFGVQQYWSLAMGPRWSTTTRLELFEDAQGQRTGFAGLYTTLTAGVAVQVSQRVLIRPELRFDYNGHSRPFEGRHGLFLAASDLIWRW